MSSTSSSWARLLVGALAVAFAALACGESGNMVPSPTSPGPIPDPQLPRPNAVVPRLEIAEPGSLAPGRTAQLFATLHQPDLPTRDVTSAAVWESRFPTVLSISPTGLATARTAGASDISATYDGVTGISKVVVLPDGTYTLWGHVRDAGMAVADARVEVVAGTGTGSFKVTAPLAFGGIYRVYGVQGAIRIRATSEGYRPVELTVDVTRFEQQLDIELTPLQGHRDVSGTYQLVVTAAETCRAALPEEIRTRRYTAIVTQQERQLSAALEGASFYGDWRTMNSFRGAVDPGGARFALTGYHDEPDGFSLPDIFERLNDGTFLVISGEGRAAFSPDGLAGALDGLIEHLQQDRPHHWTPIASCRSAAHGFRLQR